MTRLGIAATMLLLTVTSLLQALIPLKYWSGVLGSATPVPAEWAGKVTPSLPQRAASPLERHVSFLVRRASQKLFWEPSCLAQATATQILLRSQHASGVVVIGLRRGAENVTSAAGHEGWAAHAWLLGKEGALSGGAAAEGFVATTLFCLPQGIQPRDVALVHPSES